MKSDTTSILSYSEDIMPTVNGKADPNIRLQFMFVPST